MAASSAQPQSASRRIKQILRAANHFDALQLAKPYADLMGEPVWDVSEVEVSKAFRKLSLCCHPDKSQDPEAPAAFERLKKAKACLLNELDRDDYLRSFVADQKEVWEGNWAQADDALSSKHRVSSMRKEAQHSQNEAVLEAMQQRHAQAQLKAQKKERAEKARGRSRIRELEAAAAAEATTHLSDDDAGEVEVERSASAKSSAAARPIGGGSSARKRPKFL